ncbi:MAG: sigma-70 family RNA polymerase sigma factor [Clostridiales Family XIII bacterium]|nr:sigma-70 family RNA polymerase sigma factor [Clostridiales Family XIII bacterium]
MDDELRLIRKIQRTGDRAAADALVRKYYDEIHRFAHRQMPDGEAALDLTQEIFISMLKTLRHYDRKKGAGFRTWLYKITANKTVDYFRSRAAREAEALPIDDIEPVEESDFAKRFEDGALLESVRDYVNTLPADTQRIFRLHIFGGHTFAEIAEVLQMPEASVKSKYYRLINAIRKEFDFHDRT